MNIEDMTIDIEEIKPGLETLVRVVPVRTARQISIDDIESQPLKELLRAIASGTSCYEAVVVVTEPNGLAFEGVTENELESLPGAYRSKSGKRTWTIHGKQIDLNRQQVAVYRIGSSR